MNRTTRPDSRDSVFQLLKIATESNIYQDLDDRFEGIIYLRFVLDHDVFGVQISVQPLFWGGVFFLP